VTRPPMPIARQKAGMHQPIAKGRYSSRRPAAILFCQSQVTRPPVRQVTAILPEQE